MNTSRKKTYNQNYYLRNKGKILAKARAREKKKKMEKSNVIPLFQAGNERKTYCWNSFFKKKTTWINLLIALLALAMTFYLARETAHFFFTVEGNWAEAWLKAFILEGMAISFSIWTAKTRLGAFGYKLMVILIYTYTVWVAAENVIFPSIQMKHRVSIAEKSVQDLEREISWTETFRDRLLKADRVTFAREYSTKLMSLKEKLNQERNKIIQLPSGESIWVTLGTLIFFRLLVMVSNFCCLRRLGRELGGG